MELRKRPRFCMVALLFACLGNSMVLAQSRGTSPVEATLVVERIVCDDQFEVVIALRSRLETPVIIYGCVVYSSTKTDNKFNIVLRKKDTNQLLELDPFSEPSGLRFSEDCKLTIDPGGQIEVRLDLGTMYEHICPRLRQETVTLYAEIVTYWINNESGSTPLRIRTNEIDIRL